jgi:DNA-binding XRE family transcriptional regulator
MSRKTTRKTEAENHAENSYRPVPFDPGAYAASRREADPAFRAAYDALEDEFAALAALLAARKAAGLTQADVASRMGVSQPVLARIESSLGSRKHSPSLATLRRYADACGKKLVIQMV